MVGKANARSISCNSPRWRPPQTSPTSPALFSLSNSFFLEQAPNSEVHRRTRSSTRSQTRSATVRNESSHATKKYKTIKELTQEEICIDGTVYDISEFAEVHPGGAQIKVFGGNDVTCQYKMIHHGHSSNPEYYLSKMKAVGVIEDWESVSPFLSPVSLAVCFVLCCLLTH
jgi:cytochrome b involved in lipid metabolism